MTSAGDADQLPDNAVGDEPAPTLGSGGQHLKDSDAVSMLCRTANLVRRHLEHHVLHPASLHWTTYDVLHLVVAHRQIDTRTVAATSGISKATVTVAVKALLGRQLINRIVDPDDHRHVYLRPTVAGWQVLHELRPQILTHQQQLLTGALNGVAPQLLHTADTIAERRQHHPATTV